MQRLATNARSTDRFRIGTWRGDEHIALLSPKPGSVPTPQGISRALEEVRRRGYASVLTPALASAEQHPFESAGFELQERLHLLRHDLDVHRVRPNAGITIRRGRNRDIDAALALDRLAFEPFWQLTAEALTEARMATPRSRFRVLTDGPVLGYHVTGFAESTGYLQRLAVHPDQFGRGHGTALVADALHWCVRHRCSQLYVNTQETNQRALDLYLRLGFVLEPHGLAVLRKDLGTIA
jgi:ribosomal protein S18 acetylase RimI-like enzyme